MTVTTAADGHSALAILNEPNADVDLVVLDVMLPGMSGYAVCEDCLLYTSDAADE